MIADIKNIVNKYLIELNYSDVLCELKQKFLHERLMKEIFWNRTDIYDRFVKKPPIVEIIFKTRGEEDIEYWGYGDDLYMEDYHLRFNLWQEES